MAGRGLFADIEAAWTCGVVSKPVHLRGEGLLLQSSALVHQGTSGYGGKLTKNAPHMLAEPHTRCAMPGDGAAD